MIRVVLADDQAVVRAGFRALLGLTDDLEVVGEAADGIEAIDVVEATRPDVVVMDIRMPRLDGIAATRRIVAARHLGDVRVLVLTTFEADGYVIEALRAGASGFLLKDALPDELHDAIRSVAAGGSSLAPSVTALIVGHLASTTDSTVRPELVGGLTAREREVVALVGRGFSNDEIADSLFVSPLTAKTHVSRAMTKVGARDRAQLVVLAYESGLVSVGER